jgi:hypothetical protein
MGTPQLLSKATLVATALTCSGCILFTKESPKKSIPTTQGTLFQTQNWTQALSLVAADTIDIDTVNAIAACSCTPNFDEKYAYALLLRRGVVPEILVPAVREQIRANEKLKLLQQLAGPFTSLLRRLFLNDEALLDEIRSGVYDVIRGATGWTALQNKRFRFSLFPPVTPARADAEQEWNTRFDTMEQAVRWNYFFSSNGLWTGASTANGNDHSMELAQVALIASELQYIFGLSKTPSGEPYGGLTLSTENPTYEGVREFDPRVPYSVPRYISGRYEAALPTSLDGVDVALNARENWHNSVSTFSLDEQARLWSAAARMLQRTRPSARTFTLPLYTVKDGLFPDEIYTMPLIFLASLENLLTKRFINEKELKIKTLLATPGAEPVSDLAGKPRSMALVRLVEALTLWHNALQNIDDINVSEELKAQLKRAPASLKKAMQFTTAEILGESARAIPGAPPSPEYVEVAFQANPPITNDVAANAELLTTLARMSRLTVRSEFLEKRLGALINTFAARTFVGGAQTSTSLKADDLFWTLALLNEWSLHNPSPAAMPWFVSTHTQLRELVSQWDSVR